MEERAKRKLAAILSADAKGYSRLMGEDEEARGPHFNRLLGTDWYCHSKVPRPCSEFAGWQFAGSVLEEMFAIYR